MARLILKKAMKPRKYSIPMDAASPEACPMVTMLPTDLGETFPVTRSRRKARIIPVRNSVSR